MSAITGLVALLLLEPPLMAPPDVIDYAVELAVDPGKKELHGTERIRLNGEVGAVISFPRNGLEILSARIAGAPAPLITADSVVVTLPGREVSVALAYVARAPRGVTFQADQFYAAFFTCHWMVCREEPGERATLSLTLTVPAGLAVVASGTPTGRRQLPGGLVRHAWREAQPYPSYLFGFAVGRFVPTSTRQGDVTLESDAVDLDAGARQKMFHDTGAMLDFFQQRAGIALPHREYRQVVVDGDEAQEMTSFSLLGRKNLDPMLTTPEGDWAIAHELAHQWWGNSLTCADWSHFWLNEGLTTFMVAAWKEHRWGRPAYERELALARTRHQVAVAAGFDVPLAHAGSYPSLRIKRAIVYSKGALFVDAVRTAMGERAFWSALQTYTRRFAGQSVTSADFQAVFVSESATDLAPLFAAWVYPRR